MNVLSESIDILVVYRVMGKCPRGALDLVHAGPFGPWPFTFYKFPTE
jgi:hypothetical protein